MTLFELRQVVLESCAGLAALHSAGLVHRDIKPANLWLRLPLAGGERFDPQQAPRSGASRRRSSTVVIDFGMVRAIRVPPEVGGRFVAGTAGYIAPEQVLDPVELDPRSDVYALAATIYNVTTGRAFFDEIETRATGSSRTCGAIRSRTPSACARFRPRSRSSCARRPRATRAIARRRSSSRGPIPPPCEERRPAGTSPTAFRLSRRRPSRAAVLSLRAPPPLPAGQASMEGRMSPTVCASTKLRSVTAAMSRPRRSAAPPVGEEAAD